MIRSYCLCLKNPIGFTPYIEYKNETVFEDFEGIIIGKCENCGILKTFPPNNIPFNPKNSRNDMYESRLSYFSELFKPIVKKIQKYKPSGTVLDVGCSSGLLLELLHKEKYHVFGVEPNKQAFKIVKRKFGDRVFNTTLKDFYFRVLIRRSEEKFDIVIYNHVLEHIEDVKSELQFVKKILKKDGVFVLGLPNTDNIIFKLLKKYWEPLMPLEHVWHFSKKYLAKFLEKNGFKIKDVSFSNDERLDYPLLKRGYFSFLSLINAIMDTGEAMLIISQKYSRKIFIV